MTLAHPRSTLFPYTTLFRSEALNPESGLGVTAAAQIAFLGDDNLSNRSAVENLMKMGRKHYYVNFGSRSGLEDRKSTRLNSSHRTSSYAVFCLKKKKDT